MAGHRNLAGKQQSLTTVQSHLRFRLVIVEVAAERANTSLSKAGEDVTTAGSRPE